MEPLKKFDPVIYYKSGQLFVGILLVESIDIPYFETYVGSKFAFEEFNPLDPEEWKAVMNCSIVWNFFQNSYEWVEASLLKKVDFSDPTIKDSAWILLDEYTSKLRNLSAINYLTQKFEDAGPKSEQLVVREAKG